MPQNNNLPPQTNPLKQKSSTETEPSVVDNSTQKPALQDNKVKRVKETNKKLKTSLVANNQSNVVQPFIPNQVHAIEETQVTADESVTPFVEPHVTVEEPFVADLTEEQKIAIEETQVTADESVTPFVEPQVTLEDLKSSVNELNVAAGESEVEFVTSLKESKLSLEKTAGSHEELSSVLESQFHVDDSAVHLKENNYLLDNLIDNIQKHIYNEVENESRSKAEHIDDIQYNVSIPLIDEVSIVLNNIESEIAEIHTEPSRTEIKESISVQVLNDEKNVQKKSKKRVQFNLAEEEETNVVEAESLKDEIITGEEMFVPETTSIDEDMILQDDVFEKSEIEILNISSLADENILIDATSKLLQSIENNIKDELISSVENLSSISDSVTSIEFTSCENNATEEKEIDISSALMSIIDEIQPKVELKSTVLIEKENKDFEKTEKIQIQDIESAFDIHNIPVDTVKQDGEKQLQDTFDIVSISSVEEKRDSSFEDLKDENEIKVTDEIVNIVMASKIESINPLFKEEKMPIFTQFLNDAEFKVNDNIHLDCFVTGAPPIDVKWYKNDSSIPATDRNIEIYRELGVCSLEIISAKVNDQGSYSCIATNELGDNKTCCVLKYVEIEEAHFIEKLKDQEVEIDLEVYLDCSVIGITNTGTITWSFNNELIPHSNEKVEIFQESGICSLQIRKMLKELQGVYTCSLVDSNDKVICKTNCLITCKSRIETEKIAEKSFIVLPEFVNELNPKTSVHENETLSLICRLNDDCEPKPIVKWFHNGQNVENMNFDEFQINIKYTAKTGECRLILNGCSKSLSGVFSCAACDQNSNIIAVTESRVKIFLENEEMIETPYESSDEDYKGIPPLFLQIPESLELEESENVELKCQVMGAPLPYIKWYHTKKLDGDSELNEFNDDYISFNPETGIAILEIKNISKDKHEGVYIVRAENIAGNITQICHLKINPKTYPILDKSKEHGPKFLVELPEKIKAMDGDHVNFVCVCSGNPEPEISWLRDTKQSNDFGPLNINNDLKINYDPLTGKSSMQIIDLFPQDTGVYLCRAKNKHGIAETFSKLDVERKCKFCR